MILTLLMVSFKYRGLNWNYYLICEHFFFDVLILTHLLDFLPFNLIIYFDALLLIYVVKTNDVALNCATK